MCTFRTLSASGSGCGGRNARVAPEFSPRDRCSWGRAKIHTGKIVPVLRRVSSLRFPFVFIGRWFFGRLFFFLFCGKIFFNDNSTFRTCRKLDINSDVITIWAMVRFFHQRISLFFRSHSIPIPLVCFKYQYVCLVKRRLRWWWVSHAV